MVIWITGISGAGKTVLGDALYGLLKGNLPELVLLDGDSVREVFGHDLGHTEAERVRQIQRIRNLARMMSEQGLVPIVSALYSHPDVMAANRATLQNYFEVCIDAPLSLVRSRDDKGLYAAFDAGEIRDVVGLDIHWHRPLQPDLSIDAAAGVTPEELARRVARAIPRLAAALPV